MTKPKRTIFRTINIAITGIPKKYIDGCNVTTDIDSGEYRLDLSFPNKEIADRYMEQANIHVNGLDIDTYNKRNKNLK